jgi:N-acetylglutamate synthase-like GNAT family acetyltransferase
MIPFRIFTKLAGIHWALFIAEVDGQVIGCGGYQGSQQMELSNLMVHPHYRRRGIGQALLEKRLKTLAAQRFPLVTTTILASNQASLGNVIKQGFEIIDRLRFGKTHCHSDKTDRKRPCLFLRARFNWISADNVTPPPH